MKGKPEKMSLEPCSKLTATDGNSYYERMLRKNVYSDV